MAVALGTLGAALAAQSRAPAPLSLRPLWSLSLGGALSAPPAFSGARAYIPIDGTRIDAFDLAARVRLWTASAAALTRPAVGDGLIFVETSGVLLALHEADGTVAWRLTLDEPLGSAVVWDIGWLVTQSRSGVISAYRALDGHLLWQHDAGSPPSAPAALAADRIYASLADGRVLALQVETGVALWERRLGAAPGEILALDDRLFVGSLESENRAFYALDPGSGDIEWRWRTGGTIVGRPAVDDQRVYFASLDNVVRALDRNHGAQRWYAALPLRPSGPPVLAGDTILVPGVAAVLPSFFRANGDSGGSAKLPGDLAAAPYVIEHFWAPIVITVTRDIAEGDQLRALGRPVDPDVRPVSPLPGAVRVDAPSPHVQPPRTSATAPG